MTARRAGRAPSLDDPAPPTRAYQSPRRKQQSAQTRQDILAHATALFAERGWTSTGMRDVAAAAQVSVETVYAHFRSKSDLLMACIDVGVVGDGADVPLAQREEFATLAKGTAWQRADAAAALQTQIHLRIARLHVALRQAAGHDGDLRRRLDDDEERRRVSVEEATTLVAGRKVTRTERDAIWAIVSTEVWQLLVGGSHWTARQYQSWLAETIVSLLDLHDD